MPRPGSPVTFAITAQGPGDPANFGQTLSAASPGNGRKTGRPSRADRQRHRQPDRPARGYQLQAATSPQAPISYSVVVSDGTASLTRSASIVLTGGVSFAPGDGGTPPSDQTVTAIAQPASFLANAQVACGNLTITGYQWLHNGNIIPGATDNSAGPGSRYSIASVGSADAGSYACTAIDSGGGRTTSSVALLYFVGDTTSDALGLRGDYYNAAAAPLTVPNAMSGTPVLTRNDNVDGASGIFFTWASGTSPDPSVNTTEYLIRWTGWVMPPLSDNYFFRTTSDDGVRLWIKTDGVNWAEILSLWTDHSATVSGSAVATGYPLTAGVHYPIMMEYYNNTSGGQIDLWWGASNTVTKAWETINPSSTSTMLAGANYPGTNIPNSQLYPKQTSFTIPTISMTSPSGTPSGASPLAVTCSATVTAGDGAINGVYFLTNGVARAYVTTGTAGVYMYQPDLDCGWHISRHRKGLL